MVKDHHSLMSVLELLLSEIKFQTRMLSMRVSANPLRVGIEPFEVMEVMETI
jgi:hypothetical protein